MSDWSSINSIFNDLGGAEEIPAEFRGMVQGLQLIQTEEMIALGQSNKERRENQRNQRDIDQFLGQSHTAATGGDNDLFPEINYFQLSNDGEELFFTENLPTYYSQDVSYYLNNFDFLVDYQGRVTVVGGTFGEGTVSEFLEHSINQGGTTSLQFRRELTRILNSLE